MNMTVVIPTLCLPPTTWFNYLLSELQKTALVSDVLVLNNGRIPIREKYSVPEKVFEIRNIPPLGVNASWNHGARLCKTSLFLLLNDDILCSSSVFTEAVQTMNLRPEIGLLTIATENSRTITPEAYHAADPFQASQRITFNDRRSGWFMLLRTALWKPIDQKLVTFYGDDLIWARVRKVALAGCLQHRKIVHWRRLSTSKRKSRGPADRMVWKEIKETEGL